MMDNSHSINREGPEDARTTSRKLTYFKYHNIITCTWGKGNICWKKTMKYEHNQFSCFLWGTLEGKRGIFAFFILPQFYAHPPAGILTYLSTNSWYLHVGYIQKNPPRFFMMLWQVGWEGSRWWHLNYFLPKYSETATGLPFVQICLYLIKPSPAS